MHIIPTQDAAAAPAPPLAPSSPLPADGSNYAAAKQAFLQRFEGTRAMIIHDHT